MKTRQTKNKIIVNQGSGLASIQSQKDIREIDIMRQISNTKSLSYFPSYIHEHKLGVLI